MRHQYSCEFVSVLCELQFIGVLKVYLKRLLNIKNIFIMRKSVYFIFAILLVISSNTNAQEIGLRLGGNRSTINMQDLPDIVSDNAGYKTGFNAGVFIELPLGHNFSFVPELAYAQKGFESELGTKMNVGGFELPLGASVQTNLNYVEMPLSFRYNVPLGNLNLYAMAGPTLGYAVNGDVTTRVRALFSFRANRTDIDLNNDAINRFELAANMGIGSSLNVGSGRIFADVRYNHGINNGISNDLLDSKVRNVAVTASVGYQYKF